MRILIHGINFSPELTGIGKYTGEMAEWLASQGHDVRVVTALPYYPQWQLDKGFTNTWQLSRKNRLSIYRCPLWIPRQPSGVRRLLHLASFAITSLPVMLMQVRWHPDLVWVVEPPLFCAPQAWLVARLSGAKAWLHVQDFEVDAAFDLGILKGSWLKAAVIFLERTLLRQFDCVSTISRRMLQRLLLKGISPQRIELFPNWVDVTSLSSVKLITAWDYRLELNIAKDAMVVLYSGNMGNKQGLEILPKIASLLITEKNIIFVFCGSGAGREDLVSQCIGLSNVQFLDLQPYERLPALLAMADIHLLPQRADAADLVMPSKLTGMLASRRPVVATAHSGTELAEIVGCCGIYVPPEQPDVFANAILELVNNSELRHMLGEAGYKYALDYLDKGSILKNFQFSINKLLD